METTTVLAHPTRTGLLRDVSQIVGACVHTSEGGEGATSAEALARFTASPRTIDPVTGKTINLASYHAIADTDQVILTVPDNRQAYAAGGGNRTFLHICIPGRVSQTREQWLDAVSRAAIRQVAEYITVKGVQYDFPTHRLNVPEVQGGRTKGYCGHRDISWAFKLSDHTDPYPNFPWDVLAADLAELAPAPAPVFDPLWGKFGDAPFVSKRDAHVFMSGDDIRYAKGVLRHHMARMFRWWAAHPDYSWLWNTAQFLDPVTGIHHSVSRRDLMNLAAAVLEANDPNDPVFNRNLIDSMVLTQAVLDGVPALDGREVTVGGVTGEIHQADWALIDSVADGEWR